ncbi:hypothetical protein HHK36_002650 [Tetracentron sinense]|uniref:Receptor-like serine/threonine-protein kinase n=1 Tax=Tetracentron sinense TaxID=13715 RepID=A0A835DMY6_TETSI|nr:hypothetical protein HHK36_002650 [Tetracentron sinense]
MNFPFLFLLVSLILPSPSSSTTSDSLSQRSSLSVEKPNDVLISSNGIFSAGFHPAGDNAYCFAVRFSKSLDPTFVWMANRDIPVNGKGSKLSLLDTGNLILTDAGRSNVWTTTTVSNSTAQLTLLDTGNLVLRTLEGFTFWQSFDFPTDTLLPHQPLTRNTELISSRSRSNYSSGFYHLFFDNDNIIRLLFDGLEISSIYWPDPSIISWESGRTTYNNSRIALLDSSGSFVSSDDLKFEATDFGMGPKRRLTVDFDGNLRLYSLDETRGTWDVSWQAFSLTCKIHGICGPNSLCGYGPERGCSCLPGYKPRNLTDWSYGCEPNFSHSCNNSTLNFVKLPNVDFYGYDIGFFPNQTLESCRRICLQYCNCKAFMFRVDYGSRTYNCYPKSFLLNGFHAPNFEGDVYLKLPRAGVLSNNEPAKELLNCSGEAHVGLARTYQKKQESRSVKYLTWFVGVIGGVEMVCVFLVWCFLYRTNQGSSAAVQGYIVAATGFRKYSYAELKKATKGFSEEIGRGGAGVVYKGVFLDGRVAAIKRLDGANQGEGEFLAEVGTIGRINHMNLIEMWGYCAEGKHRLLVYEYMERGSLAENLSSEELDWKKRFEIAVGTARGLAYLHEECLEWVLHCDIKPQNILLDANYKPKVADFGLSKLLNRGDLDISGFSRIRGTRGYMAPEWLFNLPITSKVDVYSYGIVVLEMVTGKSTTGLHVVEDGGEAEHRQLVTWVREKMNGTASMASRVEEIADQRMDNNFNVAEMEILVRVALQCVDEERNARPSMGHVVEMLLRHENGN